MIKRPPTISNRWALFISPRFYTRSRFQDMQRMLSRLQKLLQLLREIVFLNEIKHLMILIGFLGLVWYNVFNVLDIMNYDANFKKNKVFS